jgi:hypothetical protein
MKKELRSLTPKAYEAYTQGRLSIRNAAYLQLLPLNCQDRFLDLAINEDDCDMFWQKLNNYEKVITEIELLKEIFDDFGSGSESFYDPVKMPRANLLLVKLTDMLEREDMQ